MNKALTYFTYEDVAPAAVLSHRKVGGKTQYLVAWRDDAEDSWVPEDMVSEEVCSTALAKVGVARVAYVKEGSAVTVNQKRCPSAVHVVAAGAQH